VVHQLIIENNDSPGRSQLAFSLSSKGFFLRIIHEANDVDAHFDFPDPESMRQLSEALLAAAVPIRDPFFLALRPPQD
jgi:hypothetical protein